jgi:Ni/Fe-hydrogenase subunit HybB-like protein
MVHGEAWTVKELFVYPNEYIYWTIQIVMYPLMTGLVAGAFVLSSLYHVFGVKQLKDIARFSLVFSFALLPAATLPLLMHLQQPSRALEIMLTPHFTSAIAAFGVVFTTYSLIVGSEIWFVYRRYFVETANALRNKTGRTLGESLRYRLYALLTLGAWDIDQEALEKDQKAVKVLAATGIPVACFLHGYAGFIFGSVKANALWMTPLMPVIFICSAVVSGVALSIVTYIATMELRRMVVARRRGEAPDLPTTEELKSVEMQVVSMTVKYLIMFMILAITLELLDLIFRGYTAVKSWDILRSVIYGKDFVNIFVLQYGLGNLVPFLLLILPRPTVKRVVAGTLLVLLGVFMMRWNVVIGGQAFSASFAGYMEYRLPVWPASFELYREGFFGAATVAVFPFILFWALSKILPVFLVEERQ